MSIFGYVLCGILGIVCIMLTVIILMQSDRAAGLGALNSNSSNGDTYWSKNKGNSLEGGLIRVTKTLGFLFMFVSLVINFV